MKKSDKNVLTKKEPKVNPSKKTFIDAVFNFKNSNVIKPNIF